MTDLLKDIETYFINSNVLDSFVVYRDTILDSPDKAIAIYEYQGITPLPQIASSDRQIQIVVRDKSATSAKEKAWQLYNSLVTEDGALDLTIERWSMLFLNQPPFKIKVDAKDRVYYGFNTTITTYND